MLSSVVSYAKDRLEKGELIYQNNKIRLYADDPVKQFDDKIGKNVLMVRAIIDEISSEDYQMVFFLFDCKGKSVSSVTGNMLINKHTNKFSTGLGNVNYNSRTYSPVFLGKSASSIYFRHACKI
jgi:hypothetical protein